MSKIHVLGMVSCRLKINLVQGDPSISRTNENITKTHELILKVRRRTIDELVDMNGVLWSFCQRTLSVELRMKRVAANFVPHLLTEDQKRSRLNACRELKEQLEVDPNVFLKVTTTDES
ncbi:uncharacterized protein LOC115231371 [Octopus sinensis]|uniref:Uncharacterized protein LOC115231371 n=1 Tax=Octopus sinensis TaxID=2607531 RepID=A0A6P7U8G1_9MOLL|nr:uncharacterized protein LOC115231371 [Octopus sinensis]